MTYKLPELNYPYDALEPHIDATTMEIHYTKHHNTYVTKLNEAISSANFESPECYFTLISHLEKVPESIRTAVRNNGGGHVNHTLFWEQLKKDSGAEAIGELSEAIKKTFGNFETFKEKFKQAAIGRFGSGWAWLCLKKDNTLAVCSTPNQDNPLMQGFVECEGKPLLGLDVWEHAYYLKYQNRRPEYIDAFWSVVDWGVINERYKKFLS